MTTPRLAVLLGHSHTGALAEAVASRPAGQAGDCPPLHMAMFECWKFGGNLPYRDKGPDGGDRFNPALIGAAEAFGADLGPPNYVVSFGGNDWAVLGLMAHDRRFDVVLPFAPDMPLDTGVEILPFGYVEAMLRALTDVYNYLLYLLRRATDRPILALVPPPPIGDDAVVEARMDDFFRSNAGYSLHPAPRHLRLKMWLLQRHLLATICTANRITMIEPPAAAVTPDGFLAPLGYGRDATHAGQAYGELVLGQIETALDASFYTYHWFS